MRRKSCYICPVFTGNLLNLYSVEDSDDDMKSVRSAFRWFIYIYIYTHMLISSPIIQYLFSLSSEYQGKYFYSSDQWFGRCVRSFTSISQVCSTAHIVLFWSGSMCLTMTWKVWKAHLGISVLVHISYAYTNLSKCYQSTPSTCCVEKQTIQGGWPCWRWCVSVMLRVLKC